MTENVDNKNGYYKATQIIYQYNAGQNSLLDLARKDHLEEETLPVRGGGACRSESLEAGLFDNSQRQVEQIVSAGQQGGAVTTQLGGGFIDTCLRTYHMCRETLDAGHRLNSSLL